MTSLSSYPKGSFAQIAKQQNCTQKLVKLVLGSSNPENIDMVKSGNIFLKREFVRLTIKNNKLDQLLKYI